MKKLFFVILITVIVIMLTGCDTLLPYGRYYRVLVQHNTDWQTKDETMSIHVEETGIGTLTICINGMEYEYSLYDLYNTMNAYDKEGKPCEEWIVFYHRDWFSARVYVSNHFEKGTKIKFYRVDE